MAARMSAVVLATLGTTIGGTALPQIAHELNTTEAAIIWVANACQVAMSAALLSRALMREPMREPIGDRRVDVGGVAQCFHLWHGGRGIAG